LRAIVITRPGEPDVLEERQVPVPTLAPSEVLVRVAAAGLNRADLLQRRGAYPAPPGWPADIPGLEYAGIVEAVGSAVTRWRPGDRVMGLVGGGAYSELVVVHEGETSAVPDSLSLVEAAAVPEAFITAHDALFTRLRLGPGERLLIHAVGSGVGTAALQIATVAGVTVYGTARSGWKLERATELGLAVGLDGSRQDWPAQLLEHTAGAGVDAILDLVGAVYLAGSLDALAQLGRMVCVGTVSGATSPIDLRLLLRKRLTIVGTVLRARPLDEKIAATRLFEHHVLPLLADGRVHPIVDRVLSFAEAADAHRALESNQTFGKVVLRW
jgi:putative PIG3 family NAD(P)H quinone oxidoreductase